MLHKNIKLTMANFSFSKNIFYRGNHCLMKAKLILFVNEFWWLLNVFVHKRRKNRMIFIQEAINFESCDKEPFYGVTGELLFHITLQKRYDVNMTKFFGEISMHAFCIVTPLSYRTLIRNTPMHFVFQMIRFSLFQC